MTLLNFDEESVITIDSLRSVTIVPSHTGATLTLAIEDPHNVSVVEMTTADAAKVIEALQRAITPKEVTNASGH